MSNWENTNLCILSEIKLDDKPCYYCNVDFSGIWRYRYLEKLICEKCMWKYKDKIQKWKPIDEPSNKIR